MDKIQALLLDLSGVLYDGSTVINGALETVAEARQRGLTLRFVTNTASKSKQQTLRELLAMGFTLEESELFTAPQAAREYLQQHKLRPYCLLHDNLTDEFSDINQSNPNCVLLGDARDKLNYSSLNTAFQLCHQGLPLIAIGNNKYFLEHNQLQLDIGAFVKALEWAAGCEAIIMGKPSRTFFAQVVASTPFQAGQCLMVGDDVFGDVEGALSAGLQAVLVQTGKYLSGDEYKLPEPCRVIESVAALFQA